MLGKPKFKIGDIVSFILEDKKIIGEIYIIDAWGTFENDKDASYDIWSVEDDCLYKHVPEHLVKSVK